MVECEPNLFAIDQASTSTWRRIDTILTKHWYTVVVRRAATISGNTNNVDVKYSSACRGYINAGEEVMTDIARRA